MSEESKDNFTGDRNDMRSVRKLDRVIWKAPDKPFHGTVTRVCRDGDVYVKWDSTGSTGLRLNDRLHPSILELEPPDFQRKI